MRKSFLAVALLLAACGLSAQTAATTATTTVESVDKYKVETNRFWNNCFITIGGGGQLYLGDHNKQMDLFDLVRPTFEISAGKWFTPGIGVRLMYGMGGINGATQNGSYSTGEIYDASHDLYKQKFDIMNFRGDVLFNFSNLLCGYNEKRVYSLIPYAGLSWIRTLDSPKTDELGATLGLLNTFRLSSALDLNLDARGTMVNDQFDGEMGGRSREGLFSVTVGLTYKFKQRGWKSNQSKTVTYSNSELQALRDRIAEMARANTDCYLENDSLRRDLEIAHNNSKPEAVVEKVSGVVASPHLTIFQLGKSTLHTREQLVSLGFWATTIAENKDVVYSVVGYADASTGNPVLNERLSRARAQAVYDVLVNEFKVSPALLSIESMGGVANMFYNDPALSRAVIIKAK